MNVIYIDLNDHLVTRTSTETHIFDGEGSLICTFKCLIPDELAAALIPQLNRVFNLGVVYGKKQLLGNIKELLEIKEMHSEG